MTSGYTFRLLYVWVPNPNLSIARVAGRVVSGGHHVPSDVVNRRYYAGLRNFFSLYRPLAERWVMYDNSGDDILRRAASGGTGSAEIVTAPDTWCMIQRMAKGDPSE